jgi:hypothetical protein
MNARDDCYEPFYEDLAYELYKEREFESLRLEYGDIDRELRDFRKHTDRQLRGLNNERKSLARELWQEYQFDVARDAYEVDLDGETSITMPRNGSCRGEVPRPLTRKDKRRQRKEARKAQRFLRKFDERREKSCAVISGQEDRSFTSCGRCYVARVKVSTG